MRTQQEQVEAGVITAVIFLLAVAFFVGALCTQIANVKHRPAKPTPTGCIEL